VVDAPPEERYSAVRKDRPCCLDVYIYGMAFLALAAARAPHRLPSTLSRRCMDRDTFCRDGVVTDDVADVSCRPGQRSVSTKTELDAQPDVDTASDSHAKTLTPAGTEARKRCSQCENQHEAVYKCPVCQRRLCSLDCYRGHREAGCSGRLETTRYAFIPRTDYDLKQLLRDYAFLEDLELRQQSHKRYVQQILSGGGSVPRLRGPTAAEDHARRRRLAAVQRAATKRGIRLQLLPEVFSKHRRNTSMYRSAADCIEWRIECFVSVAAQAPNDSVLALDRCPEHVTMAEALERLQIRRFVADTEHFSVYLKSDRANQPRVPIPKMEDVRIADVVRAAECLIEFPTLEVVADEQTNGQHPAEQPVSNVQ
jgi:hypothetical protein